VRPAALAAVVVAAVVAACSGDVDPPWQLDHDRIVAVRATPPHVLSGATSQLDALVAHKGATTEVIPPEVVLVVSPKSLADTTITGTVVTAPDETHLAAARTELGLAADAPVPLELGVSASGLAATKTLWLGDSADNPTLSGVTIAGEAPPASLVVPKLTDVRLFVDADDAVEIVNWLSSCGTMHDFDLHSAYLRVEKNDPDSGELALVLRDGQGGVVWQVWPITAQ
jgi:hypothetical protein